MTAVLDLPQSRRRLRNAIKARGRMFVWDLFKYYINSVKTRAAYKNGKTEISLSFVLCFGEGDFDDIVTVVGASIRDVVDGAIKHLLRGLSDRILGGGLTVHNKAVMATVPALFVRNFPATPDAAWTIDQEIRRLAEDANLGSVDLEVLGPLSKEERVMCVQAFNMDLFNL